MKETILVFFFPYLLLFQRKLRKSTAACTHLESMKLKEETSCVFILKLACCFYFSLNTLVNSETEKRQQYEAFGSLHDVGPRRQR